MLEFIAALPIFTFIHFRVERGAPQPAHVVVVQEAVQALLVLLATFILSRIEKRPIAVYGYAGKARLVRFLGGIVCGFAAISLLVGALWKLHFLAFDGSPLGGPLAWKYAAAWAVAFIFTGIFEESLLRGYLQYTLTRGVGFWCAAIILSTTFGAIHGSNPGESPVGLFSAAAIGLIFCLSLWYTGSLWWAIGFHAAWDWGETYLYSVPDSGTMMPGHLLRSNLSGPNWLTGGSVGPEGSSLIFILIVGLWIAFDRAYPAAKYVAPSMKAGSFEE